MLVVDRPVELEQRVLDRNLRAAGNAEIANVHAIAALGDGCSRTHEARRDGDIGFGVADRAVVRRVARAHELFVAGEEEQLVGDDRATEGEALGLFLELGRIEVAVGGHVVALASQAVIAVNVINAALELVGAALGHRVDVGAGIAFLGHVVVADIDLNRLDRVDRDRLFERGQAVGFEAEGVAGGHAVDRDRVVSRVLAQRRDLAALFVGLRNARVDSGVILQVALDRGQRVELGAADIGARTHVGPVEGAVGRLTGDDHGGGAELGVEAQCLGERQHDAFTLLRLAVLAEGDGVGPADAQTAGGVAAVRIGDSIADRLGFGVQYRHRHASQRFAVTSNDPPADCGRGVLCQRGCSHDDGHCGAQSGAREIVPKLSIHQSTPG